MHDSSSDDDDPHPRRGLGRSVSKPSILQQPSHSPLPASPQSSDANGSPRASSEDDVYIPGVPSTFGGAKSRVRKRRRTMNAPSRRAPPRQRPEKPELPGDWERHTRGIASKLLAKHGFTGRLGKRGDGIVAPIQPVRRPQKLGLGAGDFAEKTDERVVEDDVEMRKRQTEVKPKRWRKEKEVGVDVPAVRRAEKVVDMRGEVPKVVESVGKAIEDGEGMITNGEGVKKDLFAAPEVLFNLRLLNDGARKGVEDAKRRKANENLIMETTRSEINKLSKERDDALAELKVLAAVESQLDAMEEACEKDDNIPFEEAVVAIVSHLSIMTESAYLSKSVVTAAISDLVRQRLGAKLDVCLANATEHGNADKAIARHIYFVLTSIRDVMDIEDYARLCTHIVLSRLRLLMSPPHWDVVRGACVADILSIMRLALPDALVQIFADDILVPKLVSRLRQSHVSPLSDDVPAHVWIHPWLPVAGRRALVEVLHHVRLSLSRALQAWKPVTVADADDPPDVDEDAALIGLVRTWSRVLSRRKLQLAISRHILPKLGTFVSACRNGGVDRVDVALRRVAAWADVSSSRLLGRSLIQPLMQGPGSFLRDVAFTQGWKAGKSQYVAWMLILPDRLRAQMHAGLAGLLFVLHAARVASPELRERLRVAQVGILCKNRFGRVKKAVGATVRPKGRGGLTEVVQMVGRQEGIAVVGQPDEGGLPTFRVGAVRVVADVRRGVLVVGGRIVDVQEMVMLAKVR